MGYDLWNHSRFLHHKVRNMVRRGWLLKTYNDKKMLAGKVQSGEKIINDELDIIQPIGYNAHVKHDDKCEVMTMDVGGDTSRRVVWMVMGDREQHPQPDENESFFYAPGEKAEKGVPKQFLRHKKKSDQGGGGGGGGGAQIEVRKPREYDEAMIQRAAAGDESAIDTLIEIARERAAAGGQSQRQKKESGRVAGMHWDSAETKVSGQNKETFQMKSDKGIGYKTDANFDIKAANATQFEAGKHVMKGTVYHGSDTFTSGVEHAADHVAGGGASVGSLPTRSLAEYMRMPGGGTGLPEGTPDGSQTMSASGQPGTISLAGMAGAMGFSSMSSGGQGTPTGGGMNGRQDQMEQRQDQQEQQASEDKDRIIRRIERIEDHLGIGPPPWW